MGVSAPPWTQTHCRRDSAINISLTPELSEQLVDLYISSSMNNKKTKLATTHLMDKDDTKPPGGEKKMVIVRGNEW
jgi:predicted glycosyl hydrolase (DUF1957 family)